MVKAKRIWLSAFALVMIMLYSVPLFAADKPEPKPKSLPKETKQSKGDTVNEMMKVLTEWANQGDTEAQYAIGYLYFTGKGRWGEDDSKAVSWWQKAAEAGHAEAAAYCGIMFERGWGVSLYSEKAANYYQKAFQKGSPTAALILGVNEYKKKGGVKQEAVDFLSFAAKYGDKTVRRIADDIIKTGFENKKDSMETFNWRSEAQKTSLSDFLVQLGVLYYGDSATANKGVKCWEFAKDLKNIKSTGLLGTAYYEGRGIGQDYKKAIALLDEAAKKKNPLAQYTLGKAYRDGNGVTQNLEFALRYFKAAAAQGIEQASEAADEAEGRKIT